MNCIKVLEYLKDYEIQPCNERICRALKQYGKNKENICKLWEQVLSSVNNKKEAINSILVKDIWLQNNKSNSNEDNNMNNEQQKSKNYSYPTPDKSIFFNEYENNSMNNFLPSPEYKPLYLKSTYNNNCNSNNNYNDNSNNNMNSTKNSNSFSSSSDEFSCQYPANYKPAWTISFEQLRNGCNNNNSYNNFTSFNNYNITKQYPSPISSPSLFNNCFNN